jgi:hypothetical protein
MRVSNKSFLIFLVLPALLFVACTHKFQKELEEVEQMQIKVQGVKDTFETIDPNKIDEAFAEYNMLMAQIKQFFVPDSITHEQSMLIDNYKGLKKGAQSFKGDYGNLKNNITLLETQLEKLKSDFENNAIAPENCETFLNHERNNVELIQKNLGTLVFNYEFVLTAQDSLAPKIKSLLFKDVQ